MTQMLIINPCSKNGHWLLNLTINDKAKRIPVCLNKITALFHQSRQGDINSILTVYDWYCIIRQVEGYFDKEINRLGKLIKRKVKDKITWDNSKASYQLKISNPISAAFAKLLGKYDQLMCICDACFTFCIFKKKRFLEKRNQVYTKALLRLVMSICQHKLQKKPMVFNAALTDDIKQKLVVALNANVMPVYPEEIYGKLKKLAF